jgi:hypothetical protein
MLKVSWQNPPQARNGGIHGSALIVNGSPQELHLTLIVEAVNEIGKAFALAYQRLDMASNSVSAETSFDVNLPRGTYTVRADAIGETASGQQTLREHAESDVPIVVQ